jgi:hypothetical protein
MVDRFLSCFMTFMKLCPTIFTLFFSLTILSYEAKVFAMPLKTFKIPIVPLVCHMTRRDPRKTYGMEHLSPTFE